MKVEAIRRSYPEWLIMYILGIDLINGMVSSFIPKAYFLFYTIDLANLLLLISIIYKKNYGKIRWNGSKGIFYYVIAFFVFSLLVSFTRVESLLLLLWAIRNNFRYFVFFFACIFFLKKRKDVFSGLIWVNFFAVLFEFFIFGKYQDWVGGLFGFIGGDVNAPLNIFLLIISIRSIVGYLNKKEGLRTFLLKTAGSFMIAAISELKIFYIEFALIGILAMLITRYTYKKLSIILIFMMGAFISIRILYLIIPELDPHFFTISHMYRYVTSSQGYTSQGDMNRFTFWKQCNEILKTKMNIKIGSGLGNCEMATNHGWNSSFYDHYAYTHYHWFSSSFIYLELGIVGLLSYFSFFILLNIKIRKMRKTYGSGGLDHQVGEILSLMVMILLLYNTSMRGNHAYLIYYVLAMPFIKKFDHVTRD